MSGEAEDRGGHAPNRLRLKKLDLDQVMRIDELLDSVGEYGEVHLVVQHGQLRYINRVESHKAWKGQSALKGTK